MYASPAHLRSPLLSHARRRFLHNNQLTNLPSFATLSTLTNLCAYQDALGCRRSVPPFHAHIHTEIERKRRERERERERDPRTHRTYRGASPLMAQAALRQPADGHRQRGVQPAHAPHLAVRFGEDFCHTVFLPKAISKAPLAHTRAGIWALTG